MRLLKGVSKFFGPKYVYNAIKDRLDEMSIPYGSFEVSVFETFHSMSTGNTLPYYKVSSPDKETMDLITGIRELCYTRNLTWDHMKKSEITQCFNCYRFGHSQRGECFHNKRCKKCGAEGEHECKVEAIPQYDEKGVWQNIYKNYVCCNCSTAEAKVLGHPPTWSGCD